MYPTQTAVQHSALFGERNELRRLLLFQPECVRNEGGLLRKEARFLYLYKNKFKNLIKKKIYGKLVK